MRYKNIIISMLLLTLQNYAIDLNDTNRIIKEASEATIEIGKELDRVLKEESTTLEENISSNIESNTTEERNAIVEDAIPNPTIESVIQIESNLTAEVNSSIEESNITQKETFDISKGDLERGEKIYKEHLKNICETKKSELSEHYSQEDWEAFAESGKFEETIFEICPQIEPSYNKEWSADLYQFYYQNARDQEEIPEC